MTFVDISTLNSGVVLVVIDSIERITRALASDDKSALTRVEFAGELQLTPEDAKALVGRLGAAAKLARFTAPDGSTIYLGKGAVTAIRPADPHLDPPNTNAAISVAGHRQAVQETVAEVRNVLSA